MSDWRRAASGEHVLQGVFGGWRRVLHGELDRCVYLLRDFLGNCLGVLLGEHTRLVNRVFREVDGVVYPVILEDDKPEDDVLMAVDPATGISSIPAEA